MGIHLKGVTTYVHINSCTNMFLEVLVIILKTQPKISSIKQHINKVWYTHKNGNKWKNLYGQYDVEKRRPGTKEHKIYGLRSSRTCRIICDDRNLNSHFMWYGNELEKRCKELSRIWKCSMPW